jgi:suppressor for copper-sensitivity B
VLPRSGLHRLLQLALLLAVVAAPAAGRAETAASAWFTTEHGAVRLIAAVSAVGTGPTVPLALQFRMAPDWKVYWRSPGDAGFPPQIDWSESDNFAGATLHWPAPVRFSIAGFETVGYSDNLVLPIDVRLDGPGEPAALAARVDYLTCKDICVPYTAALILRLPAGPATPAAEAPLIAAALTRLPGDNGDQGLAIERAESGGGASAAPHLVVSALADPAFSAPDLFVEAGDDLVFSAPAVVLTDGGRRATLTVPVSGDGATLAGRTVTLTLTDGPRAIEHTASVIAAPPGAAAAASTRSLPLILALAVLGGLILNLMPCVLPVLSMKLLAVVGHGGSDRRAVRASFIASAAGILASFLLLAGALIALRAAGVAAGWGLQFQAPAFLVGMVLVLTLFACNLWGLFEVPLPQAIARADHRVQRLPGLAGHFFTGALATLLATPCSAPFLGTAIGFALARGALDILLVFTALAIGLALPYLAIAARPSLVTRLPRPGQWMVTLRWVMGLALAATATWLLSILAANVSPAYALAIGGLAAMIIVVLALGRSNGRLSRLAPAGVVALSLGAFFWPAPAAVDRAAAGSEPGGGAAWEPLDKERIASLVAAGRTVFVNVTADWCLTCKLNERLVLAREPVAGRLQTPGIVVMQGDWTRPDAAIARYLASFGRYGIPFDAVYGPALPEGEALPELLTAGAVLDALDRAQTARPAASAQAGSQAATTSEAALPAPGR